MAYLDTLVGVILGMLLGYIINKIITKHYFCKEADHNYEYCLGRSMDGVPHKDCINCKDFCG